MAEALARSTEYAGVDLVGTIGTYYTDHNDTRFRLALETAANWSKTDRPLVAVDASKDEYFADELRDKGVYVVKANPGGIAAQAQQGVGFAVANGAERVVRHEPEKTRMPLFAQQISDELDDTDVLVIGRTSAAEASLPPEQRRTERLAGWILEKTLDLPPDALSGGRGYTAEGARTLADYPAGDPKMNNWIYLYENVLKARESGLRTGGISVELTHPPLMVKEETGSPVFEAKRYMQFKLQLDYLLRRPEVNPEAADITNVVLDGMSDLREQATADDIPAYREYLSGLEGYLGAQHGYQPAVDRI